MACAGCGKGPCACAIQQGTGVTITGNGTPDSPWVINTTGGGGGGGSDSSVTYVDAVDVLGTARYGNPPAGLSVGVDGGSALPDGLKVLLTNESNRVNNGPWIAHSGAWVRPPGWTNGTLVDDGSLVMVGYWWGGNWWESLWVLEGTGSTGYNGATIGTDNLFFDCLASWEASSVQVGNDNHPGLSVHRMYWNADFGDPGEQGRVYVDDFDNTLKVRAFASRAPIGSTTTLIYAGSPPSLSSWEENGVGGGGSPGASGCKITVGGTNNRDITVPQGIYRVDASILQSRSGRTPAAAYYYQVELLPGSLFDNSTEYVAGSMAVNSAGNVQYAAGLSGTLRVGPGGHTFVYTVDPLLPVPGTTDLITTQAGAEESSSWVYNLHLTFTKIA